MTVAEQHRAPGAFDTLEHGRRTAGNAVCTRLPALAGTALVGPRVRFLPDAHRCEVIS